MRHTFQLLYKIWTAACGLSLSSSTNSNPYGHIPICNGDFRKPKGGPMCCCLNNLKQKREIDPRTSYYGMHRRCPKCGSDKPCQTLMGFVFDINNPTAYKDENTARCGKCKWIGIVHDLTK